MTDKYICKRYEDMQDGEMVLAYGCHVTRWPFDMIGEPAYAFVPADEDELQSKLDDALKLAERDGLLAIRYYEQLKEIKRLLAAQPDTLEAYQYILGEISDIVNGDNDDPR